MPVHTDRAGYIITSAVASGAASSSAIDARVYPNYGYLVAATTDVSALIALQVSHDNASWMQHSLITALTTTATAQITDYLPYVRAVVNTRWGASTAMVHYSPGIET